MSTLQRMLSVLACLSLVYLSESKRIDVQRLIQDDSAEAVQLSFQHLEAEVRSILRPTWENRGMGEKIGN